jgi:hypothetical protein
MRAPGAGKRTLPSAIWKMQRLGSFSVRSMVSGVGPLRAPVQSNAPFPSRLSIVILTQPFLLQICALAHGR